MAVQNYSAKLVGNMAFEMENAGHKVITDVNEDVGGQDLGPRPKALLLSALVGCSGIDIMTILKKMKEDVVEVNVDIEVDQTEEDPKVYKYIKLLYRFKGNNLKLSNLEKAVKLSKDKYCGVAAMLEKAVPISYEIIIE
ncbi:MAG: OsmC family protein [Tissierellia bacterium]|nr:OsmC family protein [Tissierellia bacterium]